MLVTLLAVVALQAQAPQSPPETPATAPAPAAAPQARGSRPPEGERMICEMRAPTGSTMRRRVCRSARQTAADSRMAQDYLTDAQRGQSTHPLIP